jgi:hypothetical protein
VISDAQFKELFPGCDDARRAVLLPRLVGAMVEHGLVTRSRAAAFCSLVGHVTDDLRQLAHVGQPRQLAGRWRVLGLNTRADKLTTRGDARDLARFDRVARAFGADAGVESERRYLLALSVLTDSQFNDYTTTRDGRGTARLPKGAAGGLTADAAPATAGAEQARLDPEFHARLEAQIARGASGGRYVRGGGGAQAVSPVESPSEAKSAQETASTGQPEDLAGALIDELPINETTKRAAAVVLRKVGVKVAAAVVTLWGLGLAGKLLDVAAVAVVLAALVYHRREVAVLTLRVLRRFKGAE